MVAEDMCLISEVEYEESLIRPVILNFENGTILPGQEKNLVCQLYEDKSAKFHVGAASENMVYSGTVSRDELYNSFIAVRNKSTNKMRLVAIDYATLSPQLKGEINVHNTSLEVNTSTSELNKQFGSKRAKRQTEQRERMKLDIENVREQLEQTVADVKIDVRDIVAPTADENDSGYRPPINRDGAKVEHVYVLDDIVSSNVLDTLCEEVSRVLAASEDEQMGTCTFVTQEIKKCNNLSSARKESVCQILLYIDCLIKFMVAPAKTVVNKKHISCPYSDVVHRDIVERFTIATGNSRSRPNMMRDKCMCYILVLSMIACGYTINLEILGKELKTGIKKLQDVCRILAFTVSKETAMLRMPLPAPVLNIAKRKKKKQN